MKLLRLLAILALILLAPSARAQDLPHPSVELFKDYPKLDTGLPFADFSHAWPARWHRGIDDVQGEIVPIEGPILLPAGSRFFIEPSPEAPDLIAPLEALAKAAGATTKPEFRAEGENSFVYEITPRPADRPVPRRARHDAALDFLFISGTLADPQAARSSPGEIVEIERTWFSLYEPRAAEGAAAAPKAIALLMPGLFGTPDGVLDMLTNRLRDKGCAVLRMRSQPSRFTERLSFTIDRTNLARTGEWIAARLSTRGAECAYATQAAFAYLAKVRPGYEALPRIAIGFSGGAMTLPTVVAREPSRYAASVMVGGGCHFWLMNDTSNYAKMIGAIDAKWVGELPTPAEKASLAEAYLAAAPLDSFNTARVLQGRPVLMVHGTLDKAVPSPLGDALWERLGRPERWSRDFGHEGLFMALTGEMDALVTWIENAMKPEVP